MLREIDVREPVTLDDYEAYAHLAPAVGELRREAKTVVPELSGRRLWMVNSTAQGGGVAEMLPKMIALLRELGVDARWLVLAPDSEAFFGLTKRLHNLIHGAGDPGLGRAHERLYREVSREGAAALARCVEPDDLLVVHDPQPLGCGALLARERKVPAIWRCHIGLDATNAATEAAWRFLEPWTEGYGRAVFSAPEYIPPFLAGQATVLPPGIDPGSHKNRDLSPHKLQGVLCNAGLAVEHDPVLTPPFEHRAERLRPDGSWGPAHEPERLGLLFRPLVVQISRWDRLKGFAPLMEAFAILKTRRRAAASGTHRRRLDLARLVLAGPDPASVSDDPEGLAVLRDLSARYLALPPELQADVALISLPMASRKENALMVNALQRAASLVVQNSLEEGFGLTVAEAMWKQKAVLGSRACGIRQQIRDGIDGALVDDPEDPEAIAAALDRLLAEPGQRGRMGNAGQRRVHDEFLVFAQLRRWLALLGETVRAA